MIDATRRLRLCASLAAPCLALTAWGHTAWAAPAARPTIEFNIQAGSLEAALLAYAAQTGDQLLYTSDLIAGRQAPAIHGALPADQVLARLLAGSGLVAQQSRPHVVVLKPRLRLAMLEHHLPVTLADAPSTAAPSPDPADAEVAPLPIAMPKRPEVSTLSELVVTGSLIRGQTDPVSPIVQFSRKDMDRGGYGTVAEMLSALPQNFGGSATPNTTILQSDSRATNDTAATGVNLRGLGAQSTLVLVNGRRLSGAGSRGDFADVSAIPTAAIEHVDVLLDGASALYGSDAVGGVVNIQLKRRYDGAETRLRVGGATQGGAGDVQFGQTFGKRWTSGSLLVAYEFEHRDEVSADDRAATQSTDLRALGGTDHRLFYSDPGNILVYSAAAGGYVAAYAIPDNQNGVGLKPTDFLKGQVNLENARHGGSLTPNQDRNSVYVSLEQDLGAKIRASADVRFSRREFLFRRQSASSLLTVTKANPYFVSPDGSSSLLIGYNFGDEVGPLETKGSSESLGATAGLDIDLPHDWRLEAYGAHASETGRRVVRHQLNSKFLGEALGNLADDPTTSYSAARDGYFNPFGSGTSNSATILNFVAGGWTRAVSASSVDSVNLKADGAVWTLPGGELKVAVGGQLRRERFEPRTVSLLSRTTPLATAEVNYERNVSAAFLEVRAPLIGPGNVQPWAQRLELSLAGRIERYDDVGRTANPKFGVLWAPIDSLKLRATYGTSFRAPNLTEVHDTETISSTLVSNGTGQVAAIFLSGGNTELRPERARSWTAGFDYSSKILPGFTLTGTWFDVDFKGQIGAPVLADGANALLNTAYAPFVRMINTGNTADLAYVQSLMAEPGASVAFPASSIGAVVDARSVNSAEVEVQGIDLAAGYGFDQGPDRFDLTGSATYLLHYDRRFTPTAPSSDLVNTVGQTLALKARVQASWTRGDLGASAAVNYANPYKAPTGAHIDAWTTVDLQVRWAPTTGPLKDTSLALNAQNLFDADPPFYDNPLGVGYDPANADPLGRYLSLQLVRRW